MLTTKQAAEYVGLKPQTMRLLKHSDEGPCLPFQLFPPLRRKDPPHPARRLRGGSLARSACDPQSGLNPIQPTRFCL